MTTPTNTIPSAARRALAFCGFSGAGKTTLLVALIPELVRRGLRVAVIKHDAHGLQIDTPGKDSDRLFQAGANIHLRGPGEGLLRHHRNGEEDLDSAVASLASDHDIVLVEGHKFTPMPKVWLLSPGEEKPPDDVTNVLLTLPRDDQRLSTTLPWIAKWLAKEWVATPSRVGILIGGQSRRMGSPKHLLRLGSETLLERMWTDTTLVGFNPVILGAGEIPSELSVETRLPDSPGFAGPLAGLISAMRWDPSVAWLLCAVDMPRLGISCLHWLVAQRGPGRWAVVPTLDGVPQPTFSLWEPVAKNYIENTIRGGAKSILRLTDFERVHRVEIPYQHRLCLENINSADEWDNFLKFHGFQ